jgi:hypothetical protein
VYNVDDGSIPKRIFVSHLIECMNSYNIRSPTFYELNGLNI